MIRPAWLVCLLLASLGCILRLATLHAAPETTPAGGLRENTPAVHALLGARVVIAPDRVLERGNVIVREGHIVAVGADLPAPPEARVWPLEGHTIYAGFIDSYSEIDVPAAADQPGGGYWNRNVTPQARAADAYVPDLGLNRKLRGQGITARLVAPAGGIVRGVSAVVCTGDESGPETVLRSAAGLHLRLQPPPGGSHGYPNSPMGAMALVRQSLLDAVWYRDAWASYRAAPGANRPQRSLALEALENASETNLPLFVDAPNEHYFLRGDALGKEFQRAVILRGSGREYRRLDAIRATGRPVVLPLAFPDPPAVEQPELAAAVTLEDLLHWDHAPENAGRLDAAGVRVAFTTEGLRDRDQFLAAIRTAVERGLSPAGALRALTTNPAELFLLSDRLGTIEPGKVANLVVTDGDLFAKGTKIITTWVDGRKFDQVTPPAFDVRGTWSVTFAVANDKSQTVVMTLEGEAARPGGKWKLADKEAPFTSVSLEDARFQASFKGEPLGWNGIVRFSATIGQGADQQPLWVGQIVWADNTRSSFTARRAPPPPPAAPATGPATASATPAAAPPPAKAPRRALFPVRYPLTGMGVAEAPPQPAALLFRDASVWTSGPQGNLARASVLVERGKITRVGPDLPAPEGAVIVECAGKHLTAGIIDCHSHIATDGGINESGQTNTAEVRIGDFIYPDDPNIYRQLAGGVTAINILHGSANTIGGQNQVIKLRWGATSEELRFVGAPPGIKFALGENVKQSNFAGANSRYPQTRMGVEQLVIDAFRAAQAYQRSWEKWRTSRQGPPPRTDLELDALSEVLQGRRLIHCHAYRQDEILAFLRTCRGFNVRVATLQHVLEGYKLADVMAEAGVGGSTFSDWWAYKFEVYDAIPYNASLMQQAGVVVSLNSDFPELARRLNLEAAKAVKYGGVSTEEAWKMVTANPARQLGVEKQTGAIEEGKDADLVVWNAAPLSSYSRCEQTWVDGRKYFDREEDRVRRQQAETMRAALIQRILRKDEG